MSSHSRLFIEYAADGRSSSTRDRELLNSRARSHAARFAYQRARQRRRTAQGPRAGTAQTGLEDRDATAVSLYGPQPQSPSQASLSETDEKLQAGPVSPEQESDPYGYYWKFYQDLLNTVAKPIQSYPVALDSNRRRSIEYFPKLWSRWAADVIANRAERQAVTSVAVTSIVQRCLTDELHMMAFISYVLQRSPSVTVSKVFLLQTAGKALAGLRSRIEGGNASLEEVVWPIIFLAHFELFGSKSVAAGRAHLKAVVELGGMEYLDEVTKVYIRRMDRGWWSDYPSIFSPLHSPVPRWEKLVPEAANSDFAGSGFLDHADVLGQDLTSILPSVVDCVRAGVMCKNRATRGLEDEALQNKVIRNCQALMDALRAQLPAEPERMACIYPAMIWLQYSTWVMRDLATKASSSVDAYRKVTSHAQPNLLRCVRQSTQAHEMLLWAAAVGIATSADEAARVRFASSGLELARRLDIVDLRNSWERYIWFDTCAVIDYRQICAAFDEAVLHKAFFARQWETMRVGLQSGLVEDVETD